ncbi:MAG: NAD(P)H-quinone oxidoreductase [Gammaproteobacteria bacterium]|nr:NAD(P)H-quinone oxidoreductase [Gammaproteobacteria bacterium]MYF37860.1 NAD(P)H-quinone oxidoreductase [Gammaproteobacteria bacterium]
MKAIQVENDTLCWQETADPSPRRGEVLIEVYSTAVNRADLSQRAGKYPPPPGESVILGLECAGVIVQAGDGVPSSRVGERVCALLSGGGYAEYVVAPSSQVIRIPDGLDFCQATALPEVFATAYLNLFLEAQLSAGERALLHAGASGVGTAAIQLCREFQNYCFVTAGSVAKIEYCRSLGATNGCVRTQTNFADEVLQWTDGRGVDVILDPVGGSYLEDNLRCLAIDGRLVIIGLMGGGSAKVPLRPLMVKRQRVIGSTLRARTIAAKAKIMTELEARVWPLIDTGKIVPVVHEVYPIQNAEQAHELVASNATIGKVILKVRD